jgi:hypothetical protein
MHVRPDSRVLTLRETDAGLKVQVINAATRQGPSGLERSGSGRGLSGMRRPHGDSPAARHPEGQERSQTLPSSTLQFRI